MFALRLFNGLMDSLDHLSQAGNHLPLGVLLVVTAVGAFFGGALITALNRARSELGWFKREEE